MFCSFSAKMEKENLIFKDDYVGYITFLDLECILRTRLGKAIYPQKKEIYRNNNPKKG